MSESEPRPAIAEVTQAAAEPAAIGPASDLAVPEGVWHAMSPDYVRYQRMVNGIVWATMLIPIFFFTPLILLVLIGAHPLVLLSALGSIGLLAAFGWLMWTWPALHHRYAAYKLDERGIEIRHGVWWRKAIAVPRTRIQHTDVTQGPIERRFGFATLHIYTAGTAYSRVSQRGLPHAVAMQIRDRLAGEASGDVV